MSRERTHVTVIGGGPAGLSASLAAANAGARVTLLDASHQVGGQYWRHRPDTAPPQELATEHTRHHGWDRFLSLSGAVARHPRIAVHTGTSVWGVSVLDDGRRAIETVSGPADGTARTTRTILPDALVIATGAHDRTLPFPGWDLPGVFTGGAAQALAKSDGTAVGSRVIVAGAGPFLLPVAASLVHTGARVLSVNEASRLPRMAKAWGSRPWELTRTPQKITELAGYVTGHIRNRIPYRPGTAVIAADGDGHVERATIAEVDATWTPVPGTERTVECDALCVTHGFVPRLDVAIAAGCDLSPARFVIVDDACATRTPGVYAAGEITGIGGVDLSLAEGTVAGHCAAGGHPNDPGIRTAQRRRRAFTPFAARITAGHGIQPGWRNWVTPETVVCRCEEVTASDLHDKASRTGSVSLRSQKLTTRVALGVCQGRICGRSVEELLAAAVGTEHLDEGIVDRRPVHIPLRLGELAAGAALPGNPASPANTPPTTPPNNREPLPGRGQENQ